MQKNRTQSQNKEERSDKFKKKIFFCRKKMKLKNNHDTVVAVKQTNDKISFPTFYPYQYPNYKTAKQNLLRNQFTFSV